MAVHLPLSTEAQREAKMLMLASGNLLKPSDGEPVTVPTQDMILGSYYLTMVNPETPATTRCSAMRTKPDGLRRAYRHPAGSR